MTSACRICGAATVRCVGTLRPYLDFETEIFDCSTCGCRWAPHAPDVHERLHSAKTSTYAWQHALGRRVEDLFRGGNLGRLHDVVVESPHRRFVIEAVQARQRPGRPEETRVVEIGCSRGYLTAWFIGHGYDIVGIDVAPSAVRSATAAFGPHFDTVDRLDREPAGSFDFAIHTGTIGCVDDPMGLTDRLLSLVRPGGHVVFNAPNATLARALGTAWNPGTPPPDLITLFPPTFWKRRFGDRADDAVVCMEATPDDTLAWRARARVGAGDRAGTESLVTAGTGRPPSRRGRRVLRVLARALGRVGALSSLPAPYGEYVVLTRR